jgi:transposase
MKVDSQYSRSFPSDRLSDTKFKSVHDLAILIRKTKNDLSKIINSDILHYVKMSKFDIQKEFLPLIADKIPSNFTKQLCDDVSVAYENKFTPIRQKMIFKEVLSLEVSFYVRDSKKHRKGEVKEIKRVTRETRLSKTLTYLSKYGNDKIMTWLPELLAKEEKPKKINYYQGILDCVEKFGLPRLMITAMSRKDRTIKRYSEFPIEFKSLTFRGRSRLSTPILSYNDDFDSTIKAFINISWIERNSVMSIPVKYAKSFHGPMKQFQNKTDTSYTISFTDNGELRVILSCKGQRELPENKTNFVGIDVNTKHNLLQCSNGTSIDFDRRTMSRLSDELKKIDELKKTDKDYIVGKRRTKIINHLRRETHSKIRHSMSNMCKGFNASGVDHAVFENLNNGFGKCYAKTPDDLNQNRMMKELRLSSLKNEFDHIARKYDIATSYVHREYTSQTCSVCGCVDKENRESQEEFKCVECGYECNADVNASANIRDRVGLTVLRTSLLDETINDSGVYEPKTLPRDRVKETLLSLRKRPASMDRLAKEPAFKSDFRFTEILVNGLNNKHDARRRTVTVADMIKHLQTLPPDMEIWTVWDESGEYSPAVTPQARIDTISKRKNVMGKEWWMEHCESYSDEAIQGTREVCVLMSDAFTE